MIKNIQIKSKVKESILGFLILISFAAYYFDWLHDGMMTSGIVAVLIMLYISMIWSEKVYDERDEYIRSKVDRLLYISTLIMLLIDIVYKTFSHQSYMSEISILTVLALAKILLSKVIKDKN
jgi:hypothetical protein